MTPETTNAPSLTSRANDRAEGVITDRANDPHISKSNRQEGTTDMSIIAETADTVEADFVTQAVSDLDATPEGTLAYNGVRSYQQVGAGRWSPDPDVDTPATISTAELVAEAKGEIDVEQPETRIALPKVTAPDLARFNNLAGDVPAPWIFPKGAIDPFHTTCPAWCEVGRHEVEAGYGSDTHRSRPIPVLLTQGHTWAYTDGTFGVAHYEVSLDLKVHSKVGQPWVKVAVEDLREGKPKLTYRRLRAVEARQLAQALLAAADLADPDGEFEEAGA